VPGSFTQIPPIKRTTRYRCRPHDQITGTSIDGGGILSKLKPEIAKKVVSTIHTLRESAYQYIKKMKASNPSHPLYSISVHRDVRALLSIHDDVLVIHVLEVEHR